MRWTSGQKQQRGFAWDNLGIDVIPNSGRAGQESREAFILDLVLSLLGMHADDNDGLGEACGRVRVMDDR